MGIYILDTVLDFLFVVSKCFRIVGILVLVVPVLSFLLLIWRAQSITRVGLRACFCFCERLVADGPLHWSVENVAFIHLFEFSNGLVLEKCST